MNRTEKGRKSKKTNPKAVIKKSKSCLRMSLLFSPFSLYILVLTRKLVRKVKAEGWIGNSQQQEQIKAKFQKSMGDTGSFFFFLLAKISERRDS